MTPRILQPNFSGDSQDSSSKLKLIKPIELCFNYKIVLIITLTFSEGYTSISVREPLSKIRAETKELNRCKPLKDFDQHYSTVSDDSGIFVVRTNIFLSNYICTFKTFV